MIDSDCFVTNPINFEEIQVLPNDVMLNAFFVLRNEKLSLDIPQTHFLFFNPTLISEIKSKYKVTSDLYKYKQLPRKVKLKLFTLGIDSDNLPESATKLFDTMRVIMLLGILEGYRFNFLKRLPPGFVTDQQIHHIGASNYTDNTRRLSFFKGSYFWRRSLEKSGDKRLIDYYYQLRGPLTSQELLAMKPEFAEYASTKKFVEFVEKIVDGQVQH